MKRILGIDPGLNGAAVLIEVVSGERPYVRSEQPFKRVPLAGKQDVIAVDSVFPLMCAADLICIEHVWSRPDQSAQSGFTFGTVFGQVVALAQLSNKTVHYVPPARWKGELGFTADKALTKKNAERIFNRPFRRQDTAEAALIALWCAIATGEKPKC